MTPKTRFQVADLATDQDAAQREWAQTRSYLTTLIVEKSLLRKALAELYEATHAYLNTGSDPSSPTVQPLQEALVGAFAALRAP
jgi:hypothetical protein